MDIQPAILFIKHILRKVFLEDWVMKVVALAITLALWLGVTGLSTPTTQRLTGVPLNLRFSNNIEVTNTPTQEVTLVVSGDSRRLAQINKNDLVVTLDISDLLPGYRVINLTPETVSVSLPTGVKLDDIQPRTLSAEIEPVEERDVPVTAETYGNPAEGHEIYETTVNPPRVRVRGPAGFIRSLESVRTEGIDVSNRTSDFLARQVPISVSNPKASVLSETVVDVTLRIGEQRVERVYSVAVDEDSGRRALVTLLGGRSLFENLTPSDFRVEVVQNQAGQEVPRVILPGALEGKVRVVSQRWR